MYNPMDPSPTLVSAWVSAAERLKDEGPLYGLMLHIEDPTAFLDGEREIVSTVDAFLKDRGKHGIGTVSNTIFPADLDRGDGIAALTERYRTAYARRMGRAGEWGRYFERLVSWRHGQESWNQLEEIIAILKKIADGGKHYENATELAIFEPTRDQRRKTNRQCMSFIELKPDHYKRLHMMVVYRNHYYVQRTLGNLIGLGRLQNFIARESGFECGTLTIQSTHACLDDDRDIKLKDVAALIESCSGRHQALAA